jgi:hypothetical protein
MSSRYELVYILEVLVLVSDTVTKEFRLVLEATYCCIGSNNSVIKCDNEQKVTVLSHMLPEWSLLLQQLKNGEFAYEL